MPAPIVGAAAGAAGVAGQAVVRAGAAAGRAGARVGAAAGRAGPRAARRGGRKAAGSAAKGGARGAAGGGRNAAATAATRATTSRPPGHAGGRAASRPRTRELPSRRGWDYQRRGDRRRPGIPAGRHEPRERAQATSNQLDVTDAAEAVAKRVGRFGVRRLLRHRLVITAVLLLLVVPMALGAFGAIHADEGNAAQGAMAGDYGQVAGIPYADLFNQTAALGIDPRLVAAVAWVESGFDPDVIACRRASRAGALGIMQFMPGTAEQMGIDPCEPAAAIPAGARYLLEQKDRFGSWELALAAYNAGPGAVEAAGGIPDIAETQAYVPKVLAQWERYKAQFPVGSISGGPPGGPRGSTDRYTEPNLPATTQRLLDAVVPLFGRGYGVHCFGRRSGPSEHPTGHACDFMMSTLGTRAAGDDLAHGDAMAAWLQAQAAELDIKYIIWKNHIWSTARADEGWRHQHPESGDNTYLHYDHIHVSVNS